MTFKKHGPKRFARKTIRRVRCPYCDGYAPLIDMVPGHRADIDGHALPFKADVSVGGAFMFVEFDFPDRDYRLSEYRSRGEYALPPYTVEESVIECRRERFATRIRYCPACGRDLLDDRAKLWRR